MKQQPERANGRAEVMEFIKKAGMLLTDDELNAVSGGYPLVKTCKVCGGIISDRTFPYEVQCHCNDDPSGGWSPPPR